MKTDPLRLRDDPSIPEGLRDLMSQGATPPPINAATKAASAAAVAKLGGGAATTLVGGAKLWLVIGGLAVTGVSELVQPDEAHGVHDRHDGEGDPVDRLRSGQERARLVGLHGQAPSLIRASKAPCSRESGITNSTSRRLVSPARCSTTVSTVTRALRSIGTW